MDMLKFVLFESLLALGIGLGLLLFVLLVLWRRGGSVRPLLVGLAASAALLLMQALVVTHRERAGLVMRPIERELLISGVGALQATLAPGFSAGDMSREEFLALVRAQLGRVRINWLRRTAVEVVRESERAFEAEVAYLAEADAREYRGAVRSRWRIGFRRDELGWQIISIEPVSLDGVPANWSDILR